MERLPLELVRKIVYRTELQGDRVDELLLYWTGPQDALVHPILKCLHRGSLAQVCKTWRDVLEQPSPIWNSIHVTLPARQLSLLTWFNKRASSVRHLSINVNSWEEAPFMHHFRDDSDDSEEALLQQFLSEVVSSASNLQTLSFCINGYFDFDNDFEFECAAVAPFFPELARLHALELTEGPGRPRRTEWFHMFSHLTGLTKLSYVRCEEEYYQDLSSVPTEHCNGLFAALSNMPMLQELAMVNMDFWSDDGIVAEMPEEIGSLHQLRKLNLDGCGFERLAPNFSSLHNLESLSLTESIHALTSLQDLDKLTQLTISLHGGCIASLALVCPRNLLQLEILFPSYPDSNQLQTNDDVDSLVIDTIFHNAVSKSPPVEEVKLSGLELKAIPAPIASLHRLKRLDLSVNRLAGELCPGPWLDSVEELCLSRNGFAQLPSALLLCKGKLRKLDMSACNKMCESGELDDQTWSVYQQLVAAGTEVLLGQRVHDIVEASL